MKWHHYVCPIMVFLVIARLALSDITKPGAEKIPPPAANEPMDGYYACDGWQDGEEGLKPYNGVCTVRKIKGVYVVTWAIGGNSFTGVGLMHGDVFSVGWTTEGGKTRGVNVYKLNPDGTMDGRWTTIPGTLKSHPETLKLLRKLPRTKGDV